MAIRTIHFSVGIDGSFGAAGISPTTMQFAGVQGDHCSTDVVFTLDESLVSPAYLYRVEFIDGLSNYDTTDLLTPVDGANTITVPLTRAWTQAGSTAEVRLVVSCLAEDLTEEFVLYSLAGRLYFDSRPDGEAWEREEARGLSALIVDTKEATAEAQQAANVTAAVTLFAEQATANANAATQAAQTAATNADALSRTAQAAAASASTAASGADSAKNKANTAILFANDAGDRASASAARADTAAASANNAAVTATEAANSASLAASQANTAAASATQAAANANEATAGVNDAMAEIQQTVAGGVLEAKGYTDMAAAAETARTRIQYASRLRGTAAGESSVALSDCADGSDYSALTIFGKSTQAGTPSPNAPVSISGVMPAQITISKKNLLNKALVVGPLMEETDTGFRVFDTYSLVTSLTAASFLQPGTTYTCSYEVDKYTSDSTGSLSFNDYSYGKPYFSIGTLGSGRHVMTFTTPADLSGYKLLVIGQASESITFSNIQIEYGSVATPYSPYTPDITYPISLSAALRSVPDSSKDSFNVIRGLETRRIGTVAFIGTENWQLGSTGTNVSTQRFYLAVSGAMSNGRCLCSHAPEINPGNYSIFLDKDVVGCNISNGAYIQIRVPIGIANTVSAFKTWLAAQNTAGTPVTVVYKLATPVVTQHTPLTIPQTATGVNISAGGAPLSVDYSRSVTTALGKSLQLQMGTFSARPTNVIQSTAYLATDKAVGNADRLTLSTNGVTWYPI